MGGFSYDGSWRGVAGRGPAAALDHENWCPGEPNNNGGDEKVVGYYGVGWTDAPCWFDVPNEGMTGKSAALCRCFPGSEPDAPGGEYIAADSSTGHAALIVGLLLSAVILLCAPFALTGALAIYHGIKVPMPQWPSAATAPSHSGGGVTFSPLQGNAPDYVPPGGI